MKIFKLNFLKNNFSVLKLRNNFHLAPKLKKFSSVFHSVRNSTVCFSFLFWFKGLIYYLIFAIKLLTHCYFYIFAGNCCNFTYLVFKVQLKLLIKKIFALKIVTFSEYISHKIPSRIKHFCILASVYLSWCMFQ